MNKFELEIDKDKKYNAIILENRLQAILSLYQEEPSDNPTKVLLYDGITIEIKEDRIVIKTSYNFKDKYGNYPSEFNIKLLKVVRDYIEEVYDKSTNEIYALVNFILKDGTKIKDCAIFKDTNKRSAKDKEEVESIINNEFKIKFQTKSMNGSILRNQIESYSIKEISNK